MLTGEYVYTHTGFMRPVFLGGEGVNSFAVELTPSDAARVEVSYDPVETLKKGRGEWVPFEGGLGGVLYEATAIRVCIERLSGWVTLRVSGYESKKA